MIKHLHNDITVETSDSAMQFNTLRRYLESNNIDDQLKHNYEPQRVLDRYLESNILTTCVAVSIVKQRGEIVSFSTISHRDVWGNNYRMLSRYYKKPSFRYKSTKQIENFQQLAAPVIEMARQQYRYCIDKQIDNAFISREKNNNAALKKFTEQWKICEWNYPEELYNLSDGSRPQSWQYICWTPITGKNPLPMDKM